MKIKMNVYNRIKNKELELEVSVSLGLVICTIESHNKNAENIKNSTSRESLLSTSKVTIKRCITFEGKKLYFELTITLRKIYHSAKASLVERLIHYI